MPVSAGSLYDYYNPFAGTQRNLDRFTDLYERKKERGLREKGLGLEERRLNLGERQENRMAGSQGIEDQYKQMLINRETEELERRNRLEQDPLTAITIISKALKDARSAGGMPLVKQTIETLKQNPKYQKHLLGYDAEDFQFTESGGMAAPIKDDKGNILEGKYGMVDENGKFHMIDISKGKQQDKSESEFRQWSSQLNSLYNKRSSIRMGINPLTGIALPRTEVDAALADNEKMIKRVENRMKTQYPDQWETFGQEETQEPTPAQAQPTTKKLDKETAQQFLNQAGGDKEKARELARQNGYEF